MSYGSIAHTQTQQTKTQ